MARSGKLRCFDQLAGEDAVIAGVGGLEDLGNVHGVASGLWPAIAVLQPLPDGPPRFTQGREAL